MQQFRDFESLDEMQKKFDLLMLDKKAKEAIQSKQKNQALEKLKKLGKDAPLAKYYREQVHPNHGAMEINATGLQTALGGQS